MANQVKFTDSWLKAVRPEAGKRVEYRDTDCPGLILRVTEKGAKTFSFGYRFGVRYKRQTLGKYPSLSLKDARIQIIQSKAQLAQDIDPLSEKRENKKAKDLTVSALVDDYIKLHQKPKNKTWKQADDNLRLHVLPHIGHHPIRQVERADIHRILDRLTAEGKNTTANRVLAHARKFCNWLVERDYLEFAPTDRIKQPHKEKKKDRVLSEDELRCILRALPIMRPAHADFIRMLLLTAQRRNEVAAMRYASVRVSVWHLGGDETKNEKATLVPLSSQAQAIISQNNNPEAVYVFSTQADNTTHVQSYSKIKKTLDDASGVKDWTLHDIRRTVASKLAEQGVSDDLIKRILNHTDNSVTAIYNRHRYIEERREALQIWSDWLEGLIEHLDSPQST